MDKHEAIQIAARFAASQNFSIGFEQRAVLTDPALEKEVFDMFEVDPGPSELRRKWMVTFVAARKNNLVYPGSNDVTILVDDDSGEATFLQKL